MKPEEVRQRITDFLPEHLKGLEFHVDMAHHDPRPFNPWHESAEGTLRIFDPGVKRISREPLRRLFQYIPAKVAICRVYAPTHRFDRELSRAARHALALEGASESFETNV